MEPEDYRRTSYEAWKAMAPGWERWRAQLEGALAPVRKWLITELAPRPGDMVLELSAGAGDTGFAAAAIVGERGRLISTDFSPDMVEVARRRGAELGLGNVDYRVLDAERIELDADSVDGVLCQSGYMLTPDPAAALSEARRVLRPGGRLALSVWGAPDLNPWGAIAAGILVERGHLARPEPGAPGVYGMADEERTRGLLADAGFTAVRTAHVPVGFSFRDLDDYETWVKEITPYAATLEGLPESERRVFRSTLEAAFDSFAGDGGYELPGVALTAVAR
jgi:SAM-dependent methyltransferase